MMYRRTVIALPLLLALPAALPAAVPAAAPADPLAAALAAAWTARGVRFVASDVAARIGGRGGQTALLAVAGAAIGADGDEVETAVEIVWAAGKETPAWPLLARDLARGLPGIAQANDGNWWLVTAMTGDVVTLRHPITDGARSLARGELGLIGRPVISGA